MAQVAPHERERLLAAGLTYAAAREVIAAWRQAGKSTALLVLDLRARVESDAIRARHRARIDANRAEATSKAADVLATKKAADAAEREALAAALAAIDAAAPAAVEAAAVDALTAKGEHIAAMVTKRGTVSPIDAARHPRIAVEVARLLAERSGLHIARMEETA